MHAGKYVEEAEAGGYQIVTIPENVRDKISGQTDLSGQPIQDLSLSLSQIRSGHIDGEVHRG